MDYGLLNGDQQKSFNESILKTMLQVEQTFTELARLGDQKCLIVYDRGTMDPSACEWRRMRDVCTTGVDEPQPHARNVH